MKRIALLAITLMALSCTKQEEYTTLRFGLEGVEEHSITKATTDSVRTAIAQQIPTTLDLTLTRKKSGKTYKVTTGQSITIPVGEYSIKGTATSQTKDAFSRQSLWASTTASISIDEDVTVTTGTNSYELTPKFDCFAIVALSDVKSYDYAYANDRYSASEEGIKVRFFHWDNNYELTVTAIPKDYDTKDDARFIFGGTGVQPQEGRYYILHPEAVTTEEGGFILNTDTWTEGTLK